MSKELQKQRMPNEVHPGRSVKSIFGKYFEPIKKIAAYMALATCVGCAGPSMVSKNESVNLTLYTTTDKQQIVGSGQKIDVNWLKLLWQKNKLGGFLSYDLDDDVAVIEVARFPYKAIKLKDGHALGGAVKIDPTEDFNAKKGNTTGFYITKASGGVELGHWFVPLQGLAYVYNEKTGKFPEYIHPIVEYGFDKSLGEFIQFYLVPADTVDDVKNGNIMPETPILVVIYTTSNDKTRGVYTKTVDSKIEHAQSEEKKQPLLAQLMSTPLTNIEFYYKEDFFKHPYPALSPEEVEQKAWEIQKRKECEADSWNFKDYAACSVKYPP